MTLEVKKDRCKGREDEGIGWGRVKKEKCKTGAKRYVRGREIRERSVRGRNEGSKASENNMKRIRGEDSESSIPPTLFIALSPLVCSPSFSAFSVFRVLPVCSSFVRVLGL